MKIETKQYVRSHGSLSTLLILVASVFVFLPVWSGRASLDQNKTLHRAENLAYQILESRQNQVADLNLGSRGPASVAKDDNNRLRREKGSVGEDEWGRPFEFKTLYALEKEKTYIVVFSAGPNGKVDTPESAFLNFKTAEVLHFSQDDIGFILPGQQ